VCVGGGGVRLGNQWDRAMLLTADVRRVMENAYENSCIVVSDERLGLHGT